MILIDGGKGEQEILLSYLLDRGITKVDYIIVSHFDEDHVMGLIAVLENLKVKTVIFSKQTEESEEYENILQVIKERNIKVQLVQKGDKIILDKYTYIDILYPDFQISEKDLNNNSIVCKLNYGKFSMLFTGDIEKEAEKYIVGAVLAPPDLQSTILKIPHHGSKTSSTEEFLNIVKPKIALIGVGENNTFGHPNEGVLERLEAIRL